jgi:aspartyl protease family protein
MLYLILGALGLALVAALIAGDGGTIAGLDPATFVPLVSGGVFIVVLIASLAGRRQEATRLVRDFAVWAAVALALIAGYSYREEFVGVGQRVMSELMPPGEAVMLETPQGEHAVRIRRRGDGHFVAKVLINGASVPMLVDTGATSIVLKPADAKLAGVDTERLSFSVPVQTANGPAFAAAVRLRQIAIGPIIVEGLDALVARPGVLQESLLGINFLRRLRSYEFSGDFLTLRS